MIVQKIQKRLIVPGDKVDDNKKKKNTHIMLKAFSALSAVSGVLIILYSTSKYGPGVTHDSVAYIHSAKSLLSGEGYLYFGYPSPFIQWPPLFPTILAAVGKTGIRPESAAMYLNALTFGVLVFLTGAWLARRLSCRLLVLPGVAAVLFSIPLIFVTKYVWTETLFVLFSFLFFIGLDGFLKSGSYRMYLLAAASASLACLCRYIGITLVLTGSLFLLLQRGRLRIKFVNTGIFLCISMLPTFFWVLRNYAVSGTLVGLRTPSNSGLEYNTRLALKAIARWFLPEPAAAGIFFGILLVLSIIALVSGFPGTLKRDAIPMAVYAFIYTGYLIFSASSVAFDPIGDRYLSPIFIPLVLVIFSALDDAAENASRWFGGRMGAIPVLIAACIVLSYPVSKTADEINRSAVRGAGGFAADAWKNSPLIACSKACFSGGKVYSNNAGAVYALAGIHAEYLPKKQGPYVYGLEKFKEALKSHGSAYILWFNGGTSNLVYNVEELRKFFTIKTLAVTAEGTLYSVECRDGEEEYVIERK